MPHRLNTGRYRPAARRSERGYILLLLMLFVALLAIAAGALAPSITFQIRRDREEEMIHRGVQYSRAIRRYVKKFGRYPTRLEELESTNLLRFLRQRYKDPITGQDFKLLHVGEVQLTGVAGIAGAAALGAGAVPGALTLGGTTDTKLGGRTRQGATAATTTATATTATSAVDNSDPDASQKNPDSPDRSKTDEDQSGGGSSELSSKVFGGGPIVGVASTSKAQSIREFNHKNHYHQWQFIYDPTMDRGGLITTPAQPPLQVTAPIQQQNSPGMPAPSGGLQGISPPPVQPMQPQQQ